MVKLQDQIVSALININLDAQQKLDLISNMQQRYTNLQKNSTLIVETLPFRMLQSWVLWKSK